MTIAWQQAPRVAVIGGGLSGAAFAVHLARAAAGPIEIVVVEPRATLGAGVAYSTCEPCHRINVPASWMDVLVDQPGHFEAWAGAHGIAEADPAAVHQHGHGSALYPQRAVFGRYVDALVRDETSRPGIRLVHMRDSARTVADQYGVGMRIGCCDALRADAIVLATTTSRRRMPQHLVPLAGHPAIIEDPLDTAAIGRIGRRERILILGNGLSMADAVAALDARGHVGPIVALSRRGQASRGHAHAWGAPRGSFTSPPSTRASDLLKRVRTEVAAAVAEGGIWQEVIDAVSSQNLEIWQALPVAERRRLLRHARPFWDAHRFRLAPQVEAVLRRRAGEGLLSVQRGRLLDVAATHDGLRVRYAFGRAGEIARITTRGFDRIVVATAADAGERLADDPLIGGFLAAGRATLDPTGLGIAADADGRVLDSRGWADPNLRVVGPLARGALGELVGSAQIAAHAARVASNLAARLAASAAA
jgi:uncharacterized NAD(P)/FAD-binding protein YdhS